MRQEFRYPVMKYFNQGIQNCTKIRLSFKNEKTFEVYDKQSYNKH